MKKKTHEEFITECRKLGILEYYDILSRYEKNNKEILVRHKKCGAEYRLLPLSLKQKVKTKGFGIVDECKNCASTKLKTHDEFVNEINLKYNGEYTVIGTYKNDETKIKIKHNCEKCNNHIWEVVPSNILQNKGKCPKCFGTHLKTTKEYEQELDEKFAGEFSLLSEYIDNKTYVKIRHNCEKCNNYTWDVRPDNFSTGKHIGKCPGCSKNKRESNGYKISKNYLEENNIIFTEEDRFKNCKFRYTLPFDFHINNFLYEYDGSQHFIKNGWYKSDDEFEERLIKDRIRDKYCLDNDITLLRISYLDEDNIEDILSDFLNGNDISKYENIALIQDGKIKISNGIYSSLITYDNLQ